MKQTTRSPRLHMRPRRRHRCPHEPEEHLLPAFPLPLPELGFFLSQPLPPLGVTLACGLRRRCITTCTMSAAASPPLHHSDPGSEVPHLAGSRHLRPRSQSLCWSQYSEQRLAVTLPAAAVSPELMQPSIRM